MTEPQGKRRTKGSIYDEPDDRDASKMEALWRLLGVSSEDAGEETLPARVVSHGNESMMHDTSPVTEAPPVTSPSPVKNATVLNFTPGKYPAPEQVRDSSPVQDGSLPHSPQRVGVSALMNDSTPASRYDSQPVNDAAALGNMAQFGVLALLHCVLPTEGGTLRVAALARAAGISKRNLQAHLAALEAAGMIATTHAGQDGKGVVFRTGGGYFTPCSCSCVVKETTTTAPDEGTCTSEKTNYGARSNTSEQFRTGAKSFTGMTERLETKRYRESIFLSILAAKRQPEEFPLQTLDELRAVAREKGIPYACAVILEHLPRAKTNPGGFLHRILSEGNAAPSPARLEAGRDIVEEVLPAMKKQIGEEILPADWNAAARRVFLAARASDLDTVKAVRESVLERMRRFCEA